MEGHHDVWLGIWPGPTFREPSEGALPVRKADQNKPVKKTIV